jgi:hypothetical protein
MLNSQVKIDLKPLKQLLNDLAQPIGICLLPPDIRSYVNKIEDYELIEGSTNCSGDNVGATINYKYKIKKMHEEGYGIIHFKGYGKLHESGDRGVHHAEKLNDMMISLFVYDADENLKDFFIEDSRVGRNHERISTINNRDYLSRFISNEEELAAVLAERMKASNLEGVKKLSVMDREMASINERIAGSKKNSTSKIIDNLSSTVAKGESTEVTDCMVKVINHAVNSQYIETHPAAVRNKDGQFDYPVDQERLKRAAEEVLGLLGHLKKYSHELSKTLVYLIDELSTAIKKFLGIEQGQQRDL